MQKYSTLLILLLFFACSPADEKDNIPDTILPQEKMVDIISDMHVAEALMRTSTHMGDTDTQRVINFYGFIYKKYGVTDSIYKLSYDYYMHHPVLLDSVYSEVITKLSGKQAHLKEK